MHQTKANNFCVVAWRVGEIDLLSLQGCSTDELHFNQSVHFINSSAFVSQCGVFQNRRTQEAISVSLVEKVCWPEGLLMAKYHLPLSN
jgi:hypothetical protein